MASLGYRTFKQMQDEVSRNVQDDSTAGVAKIKDCLRRAYDSACAKMTWAELDRIDEVGLRKRDDSGSETLQANSGFFPLPAEAYKVNKITPIDPSGPPLERVGAGDLLELGGSAFDTQTGVPCYYAIVGRTAQYAALAAAGAITVKSNSANNSAKVRVTYRTSTGISGSTVDALATSSDFTAGVVLVSAAEAGWPVESVVVPTSWAGNLTIEDASANVIVNIANTENDANASDEWNVVSRELGRVFPIPTSDYKMAVAYTREPRTLIVDQDVPEIPASSFLVAQASADFLRQARRPEEAREYDFMARQSLKDVSRSGTPQRLSIRPQRGLMAGTGVWRRSGYRGLY